MHIYSHALRIWAHVYISARGTLLPTGLPGALAQSAQEPTNTRISSLTPPFCPPTLHTHLAAPYLAISAAYHKSVLFYSLLLPIIKHSSHLHPSPSLHLAMTSSTISSSSSSTATPPHSRRVVRPMPPIPAPATDHEALVARITTLIKAVETAALDGTAFIQTAEATVSARAIVKQPLRALTDELTTLKTVFEAWRSKALMMNAQHLKLQQISNNSNLTPASRAVAITDILNDIGPGPLDSDYTTSFHPFAASLLLVLERLNALHALLATDPVAPAQPVFINSRQKSKLTFSRLGPRPNVVLPSTAATSAEVYTAAVGKVRGLVVMVQLLRVNVEAAGRGAVLAGGRWEGWKGWVVVNGGEEEEEEDVEEDVEMGGYE